MSLRGILVEDWGKPGEHTLPIPLYTIPSGGTAAQELAFGLPSPQAVLLVCSTTNHPSQLHVLRTGSLKLIATETYTMTSEERAKRILRLAGFS